MPNHQFTLSGTTFSDSRVTSTTIDYMYSQTRGSTLDNCHVRVQLLVVSVTVRLMSNCQRDIDVLTVDCVLMADIAATTGVCT